VVTADSDFTALLAARQTPTPSVILLRHVAELRPREQVELLIANLPAILDDLAGGAVVSLSPRRLAVRRLPIA
jgi:predicted nuclease of predicted toxin-antitoxin system